MDEHKWKNSFLIPYEHHAKILQQLESGNCFELTYEEWVCHACCLLDINGLLVKVTKKDNVRNIKVTNDGRRYILRKWSKHLLGGNHLKVAL